MKRFKLPLLLGAIALLALAAAAPVLAAPLDTVNVQIDNRTGQAVTLTFNGPGETHTFVLAADEVATFEVEVGQYFYRYEACGHGNSGYYTSNANRPLILTKCPGTAISNITLDNQTGNPFILTLSGGGGLYGYWVAPGGMNLALPAGGYSYQSTACGPDANGILKASASLPQPLVWTWTCDGVNVASSAE